MNKDLKIIKKKFGEDMMHYLRDNYATFLETNGLLPNILLEHFMPNHYLFKDIIDYNLELEFKKYIYSFITIDNNKIVKKEAKTPKELFNSIGYEFYEIHNYEDIIKFKKYYLKDEELCTFRSNRLGNHYIFWVVRKDVLNIKRSNNPKREDDYGTSVMSIQFTKDNFHTLSIKNRYNHTVDNPDATYSNKLDNIIPGLEESFSNTYNISLIPDNPILRIPNYVYVNNKYYKYNYKINDIYYTIDNKIIDNNVVIDYPKEKYLIIDYFIIDLIGKKITLYDSLLNDSFTTNNISNIRIINSNLNKEIIVKNNLEQYRIVINKDNQIISYENNNINEIGDDFLQYNQTLETLILDNTIKIGNRVLINNLSLKNISLPNVRKIGYNFLYKNNNLKEIILDNVLTIESGFLYLNNSIFKISLNNILKIEDNFLYCNKLINRIYLPKIEYIGNNFLYTSNLTNIYFPNIKVIGYSFLKKNTILENISLPNIKLIGDYFLYDNKILNKIDIHNIKKIGNYFLYNNESLTNIDIPLNTGIGNGFLEKNNNYKSHIKKKIK